MPVTKLTLTQLGNLSKPVYKQVVYVNDATLADAVYMIEGSPDTIIINLDKWMDLGDTGLLRGAAIDTASIEALQIDAGAVDTAELAAGALEASAAGRAKMDTAYFDTPATVADKFAPGAIPASVLSTLALSDFATPTVVVVVASGGAGLQQIVAADATVNRVVVVQGVATVAAAGGPDIDVGSPGDPNGLFDDIGAGAWTLGDRWIGSYGLPATEALNATIIAAGTGGSIEFRVIVLVPVAQTANIANLAVTTAKIAAAAVDDTKMLYPALDDPGNQAMGLGRATGVWTARTGVPVAGDTVTIGVDTFEIDRIDLDSTDNTANNDFNVVTDPLVVELTPARGYAACGVGGVNPLVVGELIYLGVEYLRVLDITGNNVTFGRARGGSAAAAHANAVDIFWSASHITGLTANIPVGIQGATQAAAVGTPILAATILDDDAVGGVNNCQAQSLNAGVDLLITFDTVGAGVALATLAVAANFAWDEAVMWRGEGPGRHRVCIRTLIVNAAEAAAGGGFGEVILPMPFDPLRAVVTLETGAGAAALAFVGTMVFTGAIGALPGLITITGVAASTLAQFSRVNLIAWGND